MILTRNEQGDSLTLTGDVSIEHAVLLKEALLALLSSPGDHCLDLSGVESFDAAALQLVLAAERQASLAGKPLRLLAPSAAITETAQALGFSLTTSA